MESLVSCYNLWNNFRIFGGLSDFVKSPIFGTFGILLESLEYYQKLSNLFKIFEICEISGILFGILTESSRNSEILKI